jgi:monoamine oxidase
MEAKRRSISNGADVVIIGAGRAPGLQPRCTWPSDDVHVTIVEARDRIGGRIQTDESHASSTPVELGAEFVHGESACVFEQLRNAAVPAVDLAGERWSLERGRLRHAEDQLGRPAPTLQGAPSASA